MRIVEAGIEDLEAVLRLEREVAEAPHWTAEAYRETVLGDEPVRRCLMAAWCEGEMAGFAVAKVIGEAAELESVAVRASARRSGVGRALCGAVMVWAWERGATVMELEVRASSAGAIALYRGLGFVEVGRRRGYYAGPIEDAVLMTLERGALLDPGL